MNGNRQASFYVDLFSTASLDIFPKNTMSMFSVQLPIPLNFHEAFEVALCSYIVPNNFALFQEGSIHVTTIPETVEEKRDGERGWRVSYDESEAPKPSEDIPKSIQQYTQSKTKAKVKFTWKFEIPKNKSFLSDDELLEYINSTLHESDFFSGLLSKRKIESNIDPFKHSITVRKYGSGLEIIVRDTNSSIAFQGSLTQLLGIPINIKKYLTLYIPGIYRFPAAAPDIRASVPKFLNIYCSCVEPIITADTKSPLLKTIEVPLPKRGYLSEVISKEVISRAYLPVNVNSLQVITIEIRDPTGNLASFLYGLVHLRLHFRPILK